MIAFQVIGIAVVVAIATGSCIAVLIAGAVLLERVTGVPATDRRMPLERRAEHRARVAAGQVSQPTREDWALLGEAIAAEDERRARTAGVIRLDDRRRGGGTAA